ncbi:hypothetical protein LOK49_LG03G02390 [Camellia lanceoleosa]|uniref:Uncharacterized protein n=1 Tax=Camellia lanceoleosa TaxID=1840588 RepID=A0ACC0IDT0_9ERIC|nr:hypothetical protein LOK49_LG03G02390 [Camellia lanceoleosa]
MFESTSHLLTFISLSLSLSNTHIHTHTLCTAALHHGVGGDLPPSITVDHPSPLFFLPIAVVRPYHRRRPSIATILSLYHRCLSSHPYQSSVAPLHRRRSPSTLSL